MVKQFVRCSLKCVSTRIPSGVKNMEKGKSQERPRHHHINASRAAELLQPSFHCETRLEADSGTGFQNKIWGYCGWHVSLLWCKCLCSCFHVFKAALPPAALLERTVLPSNGGWHAVSFYPHLVISIFSLQKTPRCFFPSFLCAIKSLRGFEGVKCSFFKIKVDIL